MADRADSPEFSYTADQRAALLGAIQIEPGMRPVEIVVAVARAGRRAVTSHSDLASTPIAPEVIKELASIEDKARSLAAVLADVKVDMDETPAQLRTLRALMRRAGLDIPPESLGRDLNKLAKSARQAQVELSGSGPYGAPFALDNVLTYREGSGRKSRRGRTPNVALNDFALTLAFIYRLATGSSPTIPHQKDSGRAYGPFVSFLDAAVRPTDLLPAHKRVDALASRAKQDYESWREAVTSGELAVIDVTSEHDALSRIAERWSITWPAPAEVVTKFPTKHAN